MRSYRFLLLALALIFCLHAVAAAPTAAPQLARRQDENPSGSSKEPTATADESSRPSSTATPQSSATRSERSSTTTEPTTSSSLIPTTTADNQAATTTSNNIQPSASSSAAANSSPQLPIKPRITPAFGLAGVIMLLSGLVYAVIGIKNQWLYVFASAAYLSSLAVTVLIVYLMNPPVTDAVQGAFFVAAAITGLIFGVVALVFADITDGLGCLLGGFCLSMWLLSLKEGGLIASAGGRAIFIGCMCATGYALAWSHYTRNHGLIASISFSGATITMLGVDCFSGAGWKEFWLYLWNLNPNTFPLNTNTYPMTKGMKAELAGVIILSVLGIISQLRLWKLIKEHREQTSAQRIEKQQAQDREEEERGRNLEDSFQRERAQWEAAYGDKSRTEPAVDSCVATPKTSKGSFTSCSVEGIPLPKDGFAISNVQESHAAADAITPAPTVSSHQTNSRRNTFSSARPSSDIVATDGVSRNISVKTLQPSAPPPPAIVPLPFKIPQEDDVKSQMSDNASVSAIPDTGDESFDGRRSLPKPLSNTSALKHLSGATPNHFKHDEGVIVPHIEDDRASSIAATLDEADDVSLPDLSPPHSPVDPNFNAEDLQTPAVKRSDGIVDPTIPAGNDRVEAAAPTTEENGTKTDTEKLDAVDGTSTPSRPVARQSLTVSTDPKPKESRTKQEALPSPRVRADTVVESGDKSQQSKSAGSVAASTSSHTEQTQSVTGSLNGVLSGRLSKVAQSYRTNEWAKHLEAADIPDIDEIPVPDSPGVAVRHERPAPVSEEIVQPLTLAKRQSNRISSDSAVYQNGAFVRLSQTDLQPMSRNPSVLVTPGGLSRTGSLAHLPTVAEPSSKRVSSGPSPAPDNTLLGQREALMRRRTSSQSFNIQSPSTTTLIKGGDDMTLAARKRALQNKHQKPPSASQKWQKKSGWAASVQVPGFDSHQPKRTNTSGSDQKREVLLADWRESIRQEGTPVQSAAAMAEEQRRAALNAKRQKEVEQQHQVMVAQQRESMRQTMMRNNDMLDAHREAMRKMQAAANKRA
ncbi:hypothetical protein K458DRAFT_434256 [Lentithecium fluviatile CBS 122367]|uniref:TM7S3/TM198-like domain-containing protein n=1 Tax=Lentithecium fluviatile CBS 122367 TaxID=1168545 RepID=A0A6G1IS31_9PLEO|nr:hypothetical protein K458DRAFT_434256 [Lentithecium fluviatile CBS 122367]